MKRIIAIYGHSNCGKTETLNHVRELIRNNGGVSLSSNPPYAGDKPETFRYKDQIVCVCPGGDTGAIVHDNFNYAYSKNADIIITASRTSGATVDIINKEGRKNNLNVEWYQKSYEYCLGKDIQTLCNKEFAKVVYNKI